MRRREFITLIGGATTWPLLASAQRPTRPVFGILLVFSQEAGRTFTEPLRAYMQALGYAKGATLFLMSVMPTARQIACRHSQRNLWRSARP